MEIEEQLARKTVELEDDTKIVAEQQKLLDELKVQIEAEQSQVDVLLEEATEA